MQHYIREREKQERLSRTTGAALTVLLHVALLAVFFISGFTYLDPPPPEREMILIEFEEPKIEKPKQVWNGTRPQAVNPDPQKEINLFAGIF